MQPALKAFALRGALIGAALLLQPLHPGDGLSWHYAAAVAAPEKPTASEKEAFESAKELGTVEAWDAFLSNYPTGFHADLARAYVKKLSETAPSPAPSQSAAPSLSTNHDVPSGAGSWGGVLRNGPGRNYRQIGSLKEGEPVTLMGRTDVLEDGFPWFKLVTRSGGILCSTGAERPHLYKTCP